LIGSIRTTGRRRDVNTTSSPARILRTYRESWSLSSRIETVVVMAKDECAIQISIQHVAMTANFMA